MRIERTITTMDEAWDEINKLDASFDGVVAERDHWKRTCEMTEDRVVELRAQLATLDTIARILLPIHDTVRADAVTAGEEDCRAEWMLGWLSGQLVEARAKLAEAQRVPENAKLDAKLDAIKAHLAYVCSCEPERGYKPCNFCKVRNALTALRRRIGELEKDRDLIDRANRNPVPVLERLAAFAAMIPDGDRTTYVNFRSVLDSARESSETKEKP